MSHRCQRSRRRCRKRGHATCQLALAAFRLQCRTLVGLPEVSMLLRRLMVALALCSIGPRALPQLPELSKTVKEYVRVQSPRVVLTHVRVIDGTGAAAAEDQNVVIEAGKITA